MLFRVSNFHVSHLNMSTIWISFLSLDLPAALCFPFGGRVNIILEKHILLDFPQVRLLELLCDMVRGRQCCANALRGVQGCDGDVRDVPVLIGQATRGQIAPRARRSWMNKSLRGPARAGEILMSHVYGSTAIK